LMLLDHKVENSGRMVSKLHRGNREGFHESDRKLMPSKVLWSSSPSAFAGMVVVECNSC
jgi:hypothetical protein